MKGWAKRLERRGVSPLSSAQAQVNASPRKQVAGPGGRVLPPAEQTWDSDPSRLGALLRLEQVGVRGLGPISLARATRHRLCGAVIARVGARYLFGSLRS